MEFESAQKRREDAHDLVVMGAWYAEAIKQMTRRDKRVPDLKKLLARGDERSRSREEQLAMYRQVAERFKLPLKVKH